MIDFNIINPANIDNSFNVEIDFNYFKELEIVKLCNNYKTIIDKSIEIKDLLIKFRYLIIFGMGGSCLSGKTICELSNLSNITFCDTLDPAYISKLISITNPKDTALLFISKSGDTLEIMTQLSVFLNFYKIQIIDFYKNFFFITEKNTNLYKIASEINSKIIIPEYIIGGRYSCFTENGILPALYSNLNIEEYFLGAKEILNDFFNKKKNIINNILYCIHSIENNKDTHVMMPYLHKLNIFADWYSQLIAESSGKEKLGITPITALGSKDQHSLLQLFLAGKNDKFYTIISQKSNFNEKKLSKSPECIKYLENKSLSQIISIQANSVVSALNKNHRNVRHIIIEELNEFTLGYLQMYFMIETIQICKYWKINPFDQPAVELGKIIALEELKKN